MNSVECKKCDYFVENMFATNKNKPDSRCTHYKAVLGKVESDKEDIKIFMTVREARMEQINEVDNWKKNGLGPVDKNCGPSGRWFVPKS